MNISLSKLLPNSTSYIYCKLSFEQNINRLIFLVVTNLEVGKAVLATCSRKKELKSEKKYYLKAHSNVWKSIMMTSGT
jgi:hypothetical protein